MSLQQLGHSHNAEMFGMTVDPSGADINISAPWY